MRPRLRHLRNYGAKTIPNGDRAVPACLIAVASAAGRPWESATAGLKDTKMGMKPKVIVHTRKFSREFKLEGGAVDGRRHPFNI
jgi:hypothetical protein